MSEWEGAVGIECSEHKRKECCPVSRQGHHMTEFGQRSGLSKSKGKGNEWESCDESRAVGA